MVSATVRRELEIDELAKQQGFEIPGSTDEDPTVHSRALCLSRSVPSRLPPAIDGIEDCTSSLPTGTETERVEIPLAELQNLMDDRKRLGKELLSFNSMLVSVTKQHETAIQNLLASFKNGRNLAAVTRPARRRPDESKFVRILADRDEEIAELQTKVG